MNATEPRAAWIAPQRKMLIALLLVLLTYALIRHALNPSYVSDPQPVTPARFEELADGIDPNTADAATLAALPVIGPKRAQAIVEYRDAYERANAGDAAFKQLEDLTRVKGIGAATIEQVRPYLIFPRSTSTAAHLPH